MRVTSTQVWRGARRTVQMVCWAGFFGLVLLDLAPPVSRFPITFFLGLDPLLAVSAALATLHLEPLFIWAIALVVMTLVFGRFFCGWICPFGILHQVLASIGKIRRVPDRVRLNLPRPAYRLKFLILIGLLVAAWVGSNQVGWLDPIAFLWRALSTVVVPAASNALNGSYQGTRHFQSATLIGALFIAALALNFWVPRLYCRLLCPLGALLGLLSRFSLFRLNRDMAMCKDCDACGADCQGAAEPQGRLRATECMLCLNCVAACPRGGLHYRFMPSPTATVDHLDLGRRRTLTAAVAGVLAVPLLHVSDGVSPRPHPHRIRPPGARPESEFLDRCVRCAACMKVCPTGGLQPAVAEAGLEGMWSPVLVPRLGYCENACVLCSTVCPTAAIAEITVAQKTGQPPATEPIRIGLGFIDRGRCLPWAADTPCIVCEEVCPTSPKAVYFKVETVRTRDGRAIELKRPYVDLAKCVGCGICETRCPIYDEAAIRVTSVGETRDPLNRAILSAGRI